MILPNRAKRKALTAGPSGLRRRHGRGWGRGMLVVCGVLIWGTGGYGLHEYRSGNFHTVAEGLAYRSAQLDAEDLEKRIKQHGIRTIINLREWAPSMPWYREERAVAAKHEVEHHDFVLSEYAELPPRVMDQIAALLERVPKPVLIHCAGGADRTGLVSALFRYRLEGVAVEACAEEFSARYGHVPQLRPGVKAMKRSFWRYVALRPHHRVATGDEWRLIVEKKGRVSSPPH